MLIRSLGMLLAISLLGLVPGRALAEVPDKSPEKLRRAATMVVVGSVVKVYRRQESATHWDYQRYVAEVRVVHCEVGDLDEGDLIYTRYWRRRYTGPPPGEPSTSGYRDLPAEGETLRLYLAQNAGDGYSRDNNDGGFNAIFPNGFERLTPRQLDELGVAVKPSPPLPPADDIDRIVARFHHAKLDRDVRFIVPPDHWRPILAALVPARKDENPAKWIAMGSLQIVRKDGSSWSVSLFGVDGPLGAFAAGRNRKERVYYRGGQTDALKEALTEAFVASEEE